MQPSRKTIGPLNEGPQAVSTPAAAATGFRVFSRIVDWVTTDRMQLLNITERIDEIVRRSGIHDGLVHLQSLHTTSAVFINEWQDALVHDVKGFFEEIVSREQYYRHNDPTYSDCERRNADSHMRGMPMGQFVPFTTTPRGHMPHYRLRCISCLR